MKPGTTFTFWALAGRRDEWITMAQILQQDLQKIGLNISIQRSDVSTWLAKFFPAGKKYPEHDHRELLLDAAEPDLRPQAGAVRLVRVQLEEQHLRDAGPQGAGRRRTWPTRQKVYDTMQQIFSSYAPVMVIAHQTNIVAHQKKVQNAWEDAQGNVHLEEARVSG